MSHTTLSKPIFKQFRKGTRSCQECRRRKIKCKFVRDEDTVCEPCTRFDRTCQKQGYHVDGNLKARIIRAESTTERLVRSTDGTAEVNRPKVGGQAVRLSTLEMPPPPTTETTDTVSFLQLFDTKPLMHGHKAPIPPPQLQTTVKFDDPALTDREKLLSSISHEPMILGILETTGSWWTQWRDQGWTQRKKISSQTLHDIIATKLQSENPASIAVGLTAIAMSLFVLRPGIDDAEKVCISSSPRDLMNSILAVVDTVVIDTPKYNDHEDIILATMLRGKLYSEDSQARKGTQKLQQALQIMHQRRFGMMDQPDMQPEDIHSQQQFLGSVYEVERFMTMVFGFPYLADQNFTDRLAYQLLQNEPENVPVSLRMRAMRRVAAIAAEEVNDRNANKLPPDSQITESVAQRLAVAHAALPTEWWNSQAIAESHDPQEAFEIILSQVWYWTTLMFLWLPAVFDNNPTIGYAHCLNAARNLIVSFEALRGTPAISVQVCNCDDFMAVLAGSVLLVAMMQAASPRGCASGNLRMAAQFEQDMLLIETLKDTYRYRTHEQGSNIARQGLKVLDTLSSFFDEPDSSSPDSSISGTYDGTSTTDPTTTAPPAAPATTAIMLPYFGTIYVQSSRKLVKPQASADVLRPPPTPPKSSSDGFIPNEAAFNMVNWDDWNQFLFDTELNKDWNGDLPDFEMPIWA